MAGKKQLRQRRDAAKAGSGASGDAGTAAAPRAGPSRRSAFGLEDGLIVAVCACCALLDQVAGPLLEPSFGPAFARQGQWAWRAVGAAGATAGVALGGPRPPSARRSAAAEHGWSALLWASAAYAAMLLPLSKLAGGALAARTGGVHSLEADAQLAGAVLLGPLLAALAFYAAAHIAHGAVLPGVAILAPGGTLAAVLLRMAPLPPYPVGVSLNLVALLAGLCALARLPLRARPAVAVWLLLLPFGLWVQSFDHEEFTPDPDLLVHWHGEAAAGGFLSIVTAGTAELSYLVMKMDHSLLGGVYVTPKQHEQESIYSIFHLQEAVLLVPRRREKRRSLVVGLGPGIAAAGLQMAGQTVDVMELHGEVVWTAQQFFGWEPNGQVWARDAEASVAILLRTEGGALYDHILHDVYSGGALPEHLFSKHFFSKLAALLVEDGVLAVNYFGAVDRNLHTVGSVLADVFGHCRCFGDEMEGVSEARNFVFFASRQPIGFRHPAEADFFGSSMRAAALTIFQENEVQLDLAAGGPRDGLTAALTSPLDLDVQVEYARSHWSAMRSILPTPFWTKTY